MIKYVMGRAFMLHSMLLRCLEAHCERTNPGEVPAERAMLIDITESHAASMLEGVWAKTDLHNLVAQTPLLGSL